jgi:PAS domain S-box-containing protein
MKTYIKIFSITLAVAINFAALAQPHNSDSLSYKIKSITIASEPDYPPYSFINKEGNPDGFSVDLFKAAAKVIGIDVTIKIGVWNQIKDDLAEGRVDALPLVGRTPEREELFDFTLSYLRLHGAIFIRKGTSGIESVKDLSDKSIAVMKGDNAEEYALRNNISTNIITTHTFEEAFRLLDTRVVDAVIIQKVVGLELLRSMNLKSIVPLDVVIPDFRQDFCFAVQKGNEELLNRLNEGLSIVIANKTFHELHHKWFGPKYKEQISVKDIINIGLKFLLPLLFTASLLFIFFLRRIVRNRTLWLKKEISDHAKTNQLLEKMEISSKIGGWDYDLKTNKVTWTKGVYEIYGVSPQQFDPSSRAVDVSFYHPEDKEILNSAFQEALKTGKPYDLELRFTNAKGEDKWIWTSGQAEYQNEKIVRLFGFIMDVTESKLFEIAINDSELKMREIFNSTNEAIFIHDAITGEIIDCNQSTLEKYGYANKEELVGKGVGDISLNEHPYSEEVAFAKLQETIGKGNQTFEWLAKKKNGTTFWVEVSLRHIELNNQKRVLAVVRDTSERKKSESELQRLNNEIQAIFKASKPLQYLTTPEKLAYEIIHILEDILNYEYCAVLLKNDDGLTLRPFALSGHSTEKESIEESKKYTLSKEIRVGKGIVGWVAEKGQSILSNDVTKDPRYFPTRSDIKSELCVPIISDSTIIGVVNIETTLPNAYSETDIKILETISAQIGIAIQNANLYLQVQKELKERKAAEERLRLLNEELEQIVKERTKELEEQIQKLDKSQKAMLFMIEDLNELTEDLKSERLKLKTINKELESFSYSVSHDLRAPLRAIDGFSQILEVDYAPLLDDEGKRTLNIIRESSKKMDKLITDLLSLSRVTRLEMSLSKVDMASMANSMFHEVARQDDIDNVKLVINPLPNLNADATLMRQVWQNLLGNAIKYSKPKPTRIIEVGGNEENGKNIYYVKDNGVGFNQEYAHKIFETFQRLHKSDEFEGTGVGLSIVQRIIHRHGGNIWAESTEGEGATFWFSLPNP